MFSPTISEAIEMMVAEIKKEEGEEFVMDDRDLVGVFNDGVIMVCLEDDELKINIVAGEPMKFDYNLNLLERKE